MSYEVTKIELRLPLEKFVADNTQKLTLYDSNAAEYKSLIKKIECAKQIWDSVQLFFKYSNDKETWRHVVNLEDPNIFSNFGNHELITDPKIYDLLFERSEKYFLQNNFRLKELDWFFLNFFIAAFYRIYLSKSSSENLAKSYPKLNSVIEDFDGSNFIVLLRYVIFKIIKLSVSIYFVFILFAFSTKGNSWLGLLATILISAKFYSWYSQFKKWNALSDQSKDNFKKINNLYDLLKNGVTNFELILEDLKNLRKNGIDFPTNMYVAISKGRYSSRFQK